MRRLLTTSFVLLAATIVGACSLATRLDSLSGDGGTTPDAGVDSPADAGVDAKVDSGADADAGKPTWVDVSLGVDHGCAVRSTGEVFCWGTNAYGQIGQPTTLTVSNVPLHVDGIKDAVRVSAGGRHTCVMNALGALTCWGDNQQGQLGVPLAKTGPKTPTPTPVEGVGGPVLNFSSGDSATCLVRKDLTLMCFGLGTFPCAVGLPSNASGPQPTPRVLGTPFLDVVTSLSHTCALTSPYGQSRCFGPSFHGENGVAPQNPVTCTTVSANFGPSNQTAIGAGVVHTCSSGSGVMACWGFNSNNQLGPNSSQSETPSPVGITGWKGVPTSKIAIGTGTNCAIMANGTVECFGDNSNGALGRGTGFASSKTAIPDKVQGVANVVLVTHTGNAGCVVERPAVGDDVVKCWGRNIESQLGTGVSGGSNPTPQPLTFP